MKKILLIVALLICAAQAHAWPRHGSGTVTPPAGAFQGNPNVVVSAINASPTPVTFTATTTNGSRVLASPSAVSGLLLGQVCTGTGLPTDPDVIIAVDATKGVVLTHAATASGTVTISCGANAIYGTRFTCEGQGDVSRSGSIAGGCLIHVSMDGVTATGTNANGLAIRPYQDLEYCLDFGDPGGTETFVRPTDGTPVNANQQCGPQAAYMYRAPGTYTITATIRARNGGTAVSPTYATATATQTVKVNTYANSGTYYLDSVNGSSSNNCTEAVPGAAGHGPCLVPDDINTQFTTSHRTILLAEGSVFNCSTMAVGRASTDCFGPKSNLATTGMRLGSYRGASGAGAKPQINVTGGACALCGFNGAMMNGNTNNAKEDFVFSNLKLATASGSTTATGAFFNVTLANLTGDATHIDWFYFDHVDVENYAYTLPQYQALAFPNQGAPGTIAVNLSNANGNLNAGTTQGLGIWGGTTKNSLNYSWFNGTVSQSDGIITPSTYDTVLTVNSITSARNDDGSTCSSSCLHPGAQLLSSTVLNTQSVTFSGSTSSGTNQVTVTCPCKGAQQATFTGTITSNLLNVSGISAANLTVGSVISFAGLTSQVTILSFGSGTGGNGTYNVSTTPDQGSIAMTGFAAPIRIGVGLNVTGGGVPSTLYMTGQVSGTAGLDGVYSTNVDPGTHSPTGGAMSVFVQSQIDSTHYVISSFNNVAAGNIYGAPNYWHLFWTAVTDWVTVYFQTMQGNSQVPATALVHYVYDEIMNNHHLYKWINFGRTGYGNGQLQVGLNMGSQYNYAINGNFGGPTGLPNSANLGFSGNHLVSESKCGTDGYSDTGAKFCLDMNDVNNSPTQTGTQIRNVVFEKNAIGNVTGGGPITPGMDNAGITFRDNRAWLGNRVIFPDYRIGGDFALSAYRNKTYLATTAGNGMWAQQTPVASTASIATNGDDHFTIGSLCPFPLNSRGFFSGANLNNAWTAGTATTNLYWIVSATGSTTCKVSLTQGGSVQNAGATSTGTFSFTPVWNAPYEITDNITQDDRGSPIFVETGFSFSNNNGTSLTPNGSNTSIFDRNTYSVTVGAGTGALAFGGVAFSTWQGAPNNFDPNSTISTSAPSGWTCASAASWSCFGP